MADGIKITITNTNAFKNSIDKLLPAMEAKVEKFLDKHAQNMATKAKTNAPVDEGMLRNSIGVDRTKPLERHITVNSPYAAFREFGTGRYASQYVSSLPDTWQKYAAQFKGQKGGTFKEMVLRIAEWIGRKSMFADTAIHGTFSVKTQRRTGNKANNKNADLSLAYIIARSILIKGSKPANNGKGFLYPAYKETVQAILKDLPNLFKAA